MDSLAATHDRANLRLGRGVGAFVGVPLACVIGGDVWQTTGHVVARFATGAYALSFLAASIVVGGLTARAAGRRPSGGVLDGMGAALVLLGVFAVLATATEVPRVVRGERRAVELFFGMLVVMIYGAVPALLGGAVAGLVIRARVTR